MTLMASPTSSGVTPYGANPLPGAVEGFRWALLGTGTTPGSMVCVSAIVASLIPVSGAYYFRRMRPTFAIVV